MKYIITESKINEFISTYLNGQNFKYWDQGDDEFNLSGGVNGDDVIKYRVQYSSMVPDHSFEVIYIDDALVTNVSRIFSIPLKDSVSAIISWFNTKYEKNLNLDNFEWMNHDGDFDVEEEDF
jgi:outer membrane usher protein FimD/PapC